MNKSEINAKLYPERSVYDILGNLCNNPSLLRDPDIEINVHDFYKDIHKIAFSAINNLILHVPNRESITAIEIDNYLSDTPAAYKKWNELKGFEYIDKSIEFSEVDSFQVNYDRLKKFSLLRALHNQGFDVRSVYNYEETDLNKIDEMENRLDKMGNQDIIDMFVLKIYDIKDVYANDNDTLTYHAGDGIDEVFERLGEQASYGLPFDNGFYNTFFRGMEGGKLLLRSADSGTGKTRNNLKDLALVTMPEIWDHNKQEFVKTEFMVPGLYIGTEETKRQTQENLIAIVSGIDPRIIKSGMYNKDIKERLDRTRDIIKNSQFYAHWADDFSVSDIEAVIEQHIIEKNIKVAVFDYIQITPKISRTAINEFGGTTKRDDQILEYFSRALKIIAETYDIFILSGTQLNRNHKSRENRDASSLAGGSATQNKIDFGIQLYHVYNEDIKKLEHILSTGEYEHPNYSHWVYKNRSEPYDRHIIWTRMDLGTMHERPLFVTDRDYNLVDVPLTEIKNNNGQVNIETTATGQIDIPEVENTIPF